MPFVSSQTDPRGGSKLGAATALLALIFAVAFASPAAAETGGAAEEVPVAATEGAAPVAEAPVPAAESAAPVEAAPAAPAESAAPVEAAPAASPAPVEVAESAASSAAAESVQVAATDAAPAVTAPVENAAAEVAESATAVPSRGPEHVEAAVGSGLGSGPEDVGGAVGSAVERAVNSAAETAIVEPVARTVGASAPLDAARAALRDNGVGDIVGEAAAPVREALEALPAAPARDALEALPASTAREDLASMTDRLFALPAAAAAPDPPGSIGGPDTSLAQLPIQPAAAERPPADVASGPPLMPPADPQALKSLPPELPSLQGPAELQRTADGAAASQPVTAAAAAGIVRVDSVTGSPPAGPPSPASPSQAPGVAPGSGGAFFFVPLAALLALLALAASATSRRLGEVPDIRPPVPFVCALERPG